MTIRNILDTCFAICITVFIYQSIQLQNQINELKYKQKERNRYLMEDYPRWLDLYYKRINEGGDITDSEQNKLIKDEVLVLEFLKWEESQNKE